MFKNHAVFTKLDSVCICKYVEGALRHRYMPSSLGAAKCHKQPAANLSLKACGLGCQQLGPCHYAYSDYNSVCSHFALGRIRSCPASLPCSLGEDDSPKPSATNGDLGREQGAPKSTRTI